MRISKRLLLATGLITSCLGIEKGWAHDPHLYLYGDFLYILRQALHSKPIVVKVDTEKSGSSIAVPNPTDPNLLNLKQARKLGYVDRKMKTGNLINHFEFEPGYRVGGWLSPNHHWSLEGNYFWIHEWKGSKYKKGNSNLIFPFRNLTYTHDFFDADRAKGSYKSNLWGAEANIWCHLTARRADYFSFSVIGGFRYFNLDERFKLNMTRQHSTSSYKIKTENHLGGAQLGFNLQVNPTKVLVWEAILKGGLYAIKGEQKTFLGDFGNTVVLRDQKNSAWNLATNLEGIGTVGLQLASWFNIHFGYEVLYLSGLALAPEQIDTHTGPKSGHHMRMNGNALYQGIIAGVVLSF